MYFLIVVTKPVFTVRLTFFYVEIIFAVSLILIHLYFLGHDFMHYEFIYCGGGFHTEKWQTTPLLLPQRLF